MFLTIMILGLNVYGMVVSFQRKQWIWLAISTALAAMCVANLLAV